LHSKFFGRKFLGGCLSLVQKLKKPKEGGGAERRLPLLVLTQLATAIVHHVAFTFWVKINICNKTTNLTSFFGSFLHNHG
jgi:hypothetical protein